MADPYLVCVFVVLVSLVVGVIIIFVIPTIQALSNRSRLDYLKRDRTIVAEYETPFDLSPAAIGYLQDGHLTVRELFAMVVYLEQLGFAERKKVGDKEVYVLTEKKAEDCSQSMMAAINFVGTQPAVGDKEFVAKQHSALEKATHAELASKGLLNATRNWTDKKLEMLTLAYIIISNIIVVAYAVTGQLDENGAYAAIYTNIVLSFLSPLVIIALLIWSENFQRRLFGLTSYATQKFIDTWPSIEGFKLYIKEVELDQIRFENNEQKTLSKNKALPFSIALGLKSNWEKLV